MTRMQELLNTTVPDLIKEYGVPGVAVGVATAEETTVAGFGVTNVEHPLAVTGDTIFQVGSISKTLLGVVIGKLLQRGKVELDAPVHVLFPADAGIDPRITLRHTITHTSGIDAQNMIADAPRLLADHADDSIQASLQHFIHRPLMFEPGSDFTYSGPGIMLAAAVVERVTGRHYVDVLREEVLEPAGMATTFTSADEVVARRVAGPHDRDAHGQPVLLIDGGWQRHWQLPGWDVPGGGVLSTVEDLLRYARFVTSAAAPPRLFEPLASQGMHGHDIGLAWHLEPVGPHRSMSHSGLTIGYATRLVIVPEAGLTYTVLTNSLHGGDVVAAIERVVLDAVIGQSTQPEVAAVPTELAAALCGTYDCGFYGTMTVAHGERPGELRMIPHAATTEPGQYVINLDGADRLVLAGPDSLVTLSADGTPGSRVGFVRESDGSVSAMRFHGRLGRRLADR
ncbi:CubicO group peptidase, beta-lactamase class C family [Micromonospora viridifaciens]|uniref:CubicO group peptidase, beta-lactamase class C family n=1 Tax=Micromonospora viridifaciens TaxID=1881 RepID=A0A1C4WS83_MICVI|nr:serine hydrolase domain-containing protein [Micromonospora viridifaciens]SCE99117.1 CubicO group peptidase, beta-lactamase class C family [Micromonospora viridifaciens]